MRSPRRLAVLVGCSCVLLAATARAEPFPMMGIRAMGMGGAFTSVADDASCIFWNPAGFPQLKQHEIQLDVGRYTEESGRMGGRLGAALERVPWNASVYDDPGQTRILVEDLVSLSSAESYLAGSQHLSLLLASPRMGLAVLEERVQGVSSTVDLTHIAAGDPGGEFSITKNASFLTLSGFDRREAVVSAAAFKPEQGYLLGGNVRFIQLRTTAARKSVWEVETADPKRLLDSVRDQPNEEQAGWALDAGVILMLGRSRLAFVGRNLNGPSFAMPDDRTVRLEPQVRAGISWMKADDYAIAIDADITENASLADGKPDRRSAFGIEKWIKEGRYGIRVGVSANTAISGSPLLLTAGFSLKSKFVGGEAALISDSDGDHVSFLGGLNLRLSRGDERDKRRK